MFIKLMLLLENIYEIRIPHRCVNLGKVVVLFAVIIIAGCTNNYEYKFYDCISNNNIIDVVTDTKPSEDVLLPCFEFRSSELINEDPNLRQKEYDITYEKVNEKGQYHTLQVNLLKMDHTKISGVRIDVTDKDTFLKLKENFGAITRWVTDSTGTKGIIKNNEFLLFTEIHAVNRSPEYSIGIVPANFIDY